MNKKVFGFLLLSAVTGNCFSQDVAVAALPNEVVASAKNANGNYATIPLEDVDKHIGETVTVCGKVYSAKLLHNVVNKPTLMNLGGSNPSERIEVRIRFESLGNFKYKPEEIFLHKKICITGTISNEHGFTEIAIDSFNMRKLLREAVSASSAEGEVTESPYDSLGRKIGNFMKVMTDAYLLAGPSWNDIPIRHIKAGLIVYIEYKQPSWSYVRVVSGDKDEQNWFTGFMHNKHLGLDKNGKPLKKPALVQVQHNAPIQ